MFKKTILIICALAAYSISKADPTDRWQIRINNKVIFKGDSDNENPTASLKTSSLKATDKITISYFMDNADNSWKRTFYVNDESEKNYVTIDLNRQSGSVTFKASKLKELMDQKKTFNIYTISTPKDPSRAAAIRVRRVLLCKVEWKSK